MATASMAAQHPQQPSGMQLWPGSAAAGLTHGLPSLQQAAMLQHPALALQQHPAAVFGWAAYPAAAYPATAGAACWSPEPAAQKPHALSDPHTTFTIQAGTCIHVKIHLPLTPV